MASLRENARQYKGASKLILPIFLTFLMGLALLSALACLVGLILLRERQYGIAFLVAVGVWLLLGTIRYFSSLGCLCPLCRGPLMSKRKCEMHDRARSHLGLSYRASMMLDASFLGAFICPYCGTRFRMRK